MTYDPNWEADDNCGPYLAIALERIRKEKESKMIDTKHWRATLDEDDTATVALLDEIDRLAALAEASEKEVARLREALEGVVDDEPCYYDHHGYCQAHFVTSPCEMAAARAALEPKP